MPAISSSVQLAGHGKAADEAAAAIIRELAAEFGCQQTATGLTYYQVAKLAGQEQIGVQRVLDGAEMPSLARVVGIAAALGKTLAVVDVKTRKRAGA